MEACCVAVHGTPTSRIAPVVSTTLGFACDSPTSTLAVPNGTKFPGNVPTMLSPAALHAESISPGWMSCSPTVAPPERASMWLLLRTYRTLSRVIRDPSVPPQQNDLLTSAALPPDVPI